MVPTLCGITVADKAYKVITTKERARIWGNVISRSDDKRDAKDAARAIKVYALLEESAEGYFEKLDDIIEESKRIHRKYPTARDKENTEFQDAMARINTGVEELDDTIGQELVSILFVDPNPFHYCRDYFLEFRGFPADRKYGPKWQLLREELDSAERVEVQEVVDVPSSDSIPGS